MSATVKISAGDAAIALAVAGTATNDRFVKALWSIRGTLLLPAGTVPGFAYPVEVTRSALVDTLRALPSDELAGLRLVPGKHRAEWYVSHGTPGPAVKAKAKGKAKDAKPKRAPRTPAPQEEPAAQDAGTPNE